MPHLDMFLCVLVMKLAVLAQVKGPVTQESVRRGLDYLDRVSVMKGTGSTVEGSYWREGLQQKAPCYG